MLQKLQKEIELKKALEASLRISQLPLTFSPLIDDKVKLSLYLRVYTYQFMYQSCLSITYFELMIGEGRAGCSQ